MVVVLIGGWIRQSQYSRKELCEIFGITQNTLSNWCTGKTYPSVPNLLKLCQILNVKVEDLYKLKEEEH